MTREEAIEVYNGLINTKIKEAFEFFAPELRESWEERIRKAIIDALNSHCNSINLLSSRGYSMDDVISYLKKQKKPENVSATTMAPSCWAEEPSLQKEQKLFPGFDDLTPDEKMNHPLYLEGFDVGREVGRVEAEQKPVEWNNTKINGGPISTENNAVDIPCTEWSEEDKKMVETICKEGDLKPSEMRWLKSLRPQSHWKPSEEQMEILEKAVAFFKTEWTGTKIKEVLNLESLHKDLMKL